ncbi:MAG TPA: pirin family protein [Candidatus Saccharimonadales bacterium]|nr:pirin family protein [Candidatus Saccharimonadales bacterium]
MMTIRKSGERGHADHGWLDSYHTFSFADYYDPKHTNFRSLRVINEDFVAAGKGFGTHPHSDMEIITYIVKGALQHRDSMGNSAVMRAGDIQRISAGSGIMHSEFNASSTEPVHLLQIWLMPDRKGVKPGYVEKSFAKAEPNKLHLATSKTGRDGSIPINQDADLYFSKLDAGQKVDLALGPGRHAWLQLIEGELEANGSRLKAGDAAGFSQIETLKLSAVDSAHLLLFALN